MIKKDWIGNTHSTIVTLGAHNYATHEREAHDFYATEPKAAELLLEVEPQLKDIYECACGAGHLAKVFERHGKLALATDLLDRGFGESGVDFLQCSRSHNGDIVTNPPYRYALEFVRTGLALVPDGRKVCMFLRIQFLEGKARRKFFDECPPQTVYVSSNRIKCAMNGDFEAMTSSAVTYAWFVWEKGWKGVPSVKWIN